MTHTPVNAIPPRRWPWIVVLLAATLAIGLWVGTAVGDDGNPSSGAGATPTPAPVAPPTTPAPAQPSANQGAIQPASACLGGPNPLAAVLQAQVEAPLTGDGAAAFIATTLRWLQQDPHPAGEFEKTGALIFDPNIPEEYRTEQPASEPTTKTVVGHSYEVMSLSRTEARVAMTGTILNRAGTPIRQTGGVYVATAVDGHWRFAEPDFGASQATGDTPESLRAWRAQIARDGVAFQGGCA